MDGLILEFEYNIIPSATLYCGILFYDLNKEFQVVINELLQRLICLREKLFNEFQLINGEVGLIGVTFLIESSKFGQ